MYNVRIVTPVPFTDTNKDFSLNIKREEIKTIKEVSKDISFHK